MLNIQPKQWFQIISGTVSGLMTSAALFQQLLGQETALLVVAGLGIVNVVISSVGTALSGQAQLVKDVAAMPGVEKITINAAANPTLATVAIDPAADKISPTRQDMDIVAQTARGNT